MRISREQMMMDIAFAVAQRGTCSRLRVGAVIAKQGRVMSIGYNGAPSRMAHCDHTLDDLAGGCERTVHAEANAIVWAARTGVATTSASMFVTHMPCVRCAQLIINAGIVEVKYRYPYRLTAGIELLKDAGVVVSNGT